MATDRIMLQNVEVKTIFGPAYQVAQRDEDGEVLWENPDEKDLSKRVPKTEDATTATLLRDLLITLQGDALRRLQKSEDSHRAHKLWNAVENALNEKNAASPSANISLRESEHSWLHRVLKRKVPITKDGKDSGLEERTIAQVMWGLNEFIIRQLLECLTTEEKADLEKEEAEEEKPAVSVTLSPVVSAAGGR